MEFDAGAFPRAQSESGWSLRIRTSQYISHDSFSKQDENTEFIDIEVTNTQNQIKIEKMLADYSISMSLGKCIK